MKKTKTPRKKKIELFKSFLLKEQKKNNNSDTMSRNFFVFTVVV
jgi:hypothetical protein